MRWVRCDDARRHHAARAARGADEPKRDADCDEESLRRSHPRLAALEQTHADAIARANGADKGGVSGTLGSNLLDLTLRCVAASAAWPASTSPERDTIRGGSRASLQVSLKSRS